MIISEKINEQELELYFKYENLDIEIIIRLLKDLSHIHDIILDTTSPVYFNEITQSKFRNIFEISEIHTGQSIKIKISEKWKLELPFGLGKIEGIVPKKLGVPIIVMFFILVATRQTMGIYNEYLDKQLRELEIEVKKNELYIQMEERRRIDPEFRSATRQARQIIYYILDNQDINYFEINGITLKHDDK